MFVPPIVDVVNGAVKSKSSCSVSLVMDGDTVKIDCPDSGIASARIIGYDTPEKNARCIGEFISATRATWALRMMLWQARTIEIRLNGKDHYGRFLTVLRVNGKDVTPRMINTGLARSYSGGRRGSWCE
ncbi:MAG: thermonuclease family protein [Amylibacter sp.]